MSTEYTPDRYDAEQTLDQLDDVPWVTRVTPTDRDDATHCLYVALSVVRLPIEGATLANSGAPVTAVSAIPDKGARIYVDVRGYTDEHCESKS